MILLSTVSLLATLVYQYDWTVTYPHVYTPVPGDASEDTGSIQFLDPCGTGGLEQVYDLTFTSRESSPYGFNANFDVIRDEVAFPLIASRTFHLADVTDFNGEFSWNGSLLAGDWGLGIFTPLVQMSIGEGDIQDFFPIAYYDNENERWGEWRFAGVKNVPSNQGNHGNHVPDAGSTLLMLSVALGGLALVKRSRFYERRIK